MMNTKKLVIIVIVINLIIIGSGYYYSKNKISEACEKVFETIKDEDWRVDEYVFYPPSMKIILLYSISNPTKLPLEIEMDIDFYAGDYKISNLYNSQILLPEEASTFEIVLSYDSEILGKIYENVVGYDSFTMDGWFKVKGNVLLFPIDSSITFNNENVSSILPLFDITF